MIVLPAIDLKNGECVRLVQGEKDSANTYFSNPVRVAKYFEEIGAEFIHIVDLDGAFEGSPKNRDVIKEIVKNVSIPVEVGGGIRDIQTVKDYLDLGVSRIILGTKVIEDIDLIQSLVNQYGDKIAVSLDARNGFIATKGWTETSNQKVSEIAEKLEEIGVKTLIYTDISRDGMLSEPNFDKISELINNFNIDIIASGGVASEEHLDYLREIGASGAITGKAIYEKQIDLEKYLKNHVS